MKGFTKGASAVLLCAPVLHFLSFQTLILISIFVSVIRFVLPLFSKDRWRVHQEGFVSPGFERVAQVYRESVIQKQERGSAFAVYYKGELVVDLWGGYADYGALRYRKADSTSMAYSATKGVTAICLALLKDRGLLDYNCPISRYWPEFGQKNKKDIEVKTLLCHRAGLIAIQQKHKLSLLRDNPNELGRLLAEEEPIWTPGTAQGYHTLTFGLYADQLVRRVDPKGRSLGKFFQEEIAEPFDIDFVIGEPRNQYHRACRETRANFGWHFFFTTTVPVTLKFIMAVLHSFFNYGTLHLLKYVGNPTDWRPRKLNDPEFREIECGASHGFGTARGLAKLMGILANGGRLGSRNLLSRETIACLATPLSDDYDRVILRKIKYGPGTAIFDISPDGENPHRTFGHWGAGGQVALCDPESGVGFAYLTNYCNILHGFVLDHRYAALEKALYECLSELNKKK